jgi:2-aminoadipate transaminase
MIDPNTKQLSRRTRSLREVRGKPVIQHHVINFALGMPDPGSLPSQDISEATARTLKLHGQWPLQYGSMAGLEGLLDTLVEKLNKHHGISCKRSHLLLTAGGSQALDLICELLLDEGDVVLTEAPTYAWALHTFSYFGARIEGIPLDEEGICISALEEKLIWLAQQGRPPKLLYIIPNFQNPTGLTTSLQRRRQLVSLAQRYHFALVEDDAYFDLGFTGQSLPTLYTLAEGEQAFYLGTFSKILAPGMRLGWIVANPRWINYLTGLKIDGATSPFAAHVAYEYFRTCDIFTRSQHLCALYHRRRDAMLHTLQNSMPSGVTWTQPEGGFYIWLTLPEALDSFAMHQQALQAGVDYQPGNVCFPDRRGGNYLRLSYSYVSEEDIYKGIEILSRVIRKEMNFM